MKKSLLLYFSLLAAITITLMLLDYHRAPYITGNDYKGSNLPYSFIIYPLAVVFEFLLILLSMKAFQNTVRMVYKMGICLVWIIATVVAFINTMHGGGILAAHALWMLAVSVSLIVLLIIKTIAVKKQKHY